MYNISIITCTILSLVNLRMSGYINIFFKLVTSLLNGLLSLTLHICNS